MGATLLEAVPVARPWGRRTLPPGFERFESDEPIGEIWHQPLEGDAAPLLIKHLFSDERLSIQVHPGDAAARARGFSRGKDEAWAILTAEPGATLGLGLKRGASRDELEAAALSGEIEELVDWRPVQAGDFFFSPAGTIHAIGAGLGLIEIQQNSDVTYRLYDYGRPRELHLKQGLSVADLGPWRDDGKPGEFPGNRRLLLQGPTFVVEQWRIDGSARASASAPILAIPRTGTGMIAGQEMALGQVWSLSGDADLSSDDGMTLLLAYPGSEPMTDLRT